MTNINQQDNSKYVIGREDDGTIQITFTVPYALIKKNKDEVLKEISKEVTVPGFRKGMAPIEKATGYIPENTVLEKILTKILPRLLAESIKKEKLMLAIYPKFELVKAKEDEDWQIRATSCELPKVELGEYKKIISGVLRSKSIWTPSSSAKQDIDEKDKDTRLAREQEVLKALIETVKIKIPKILIEEEVNIHLSKLLEKIEKLGLNLDSYLASIGKTADDLRKDYEKQSSDSISLELILNEIANAENIKVSNTELDDAITASQADSKLASDVSNPDKHRYIESVLKRRKALQYLISLP
ncbi:hypothetical protein A2955_05340 [Candidatus Woesebacteria bacterium RIFCSPLOWO2_01_FULL_37_19]|uniref:Trigger factor n=2 Tax=Candidatus Woeseibacteriota TaxID=1752722 RepID=A0A1F8B7B0_9BACT|nr:MAG: hypothetical protein A2771_04485 [Candidatus Woesebacteria bacterium RIFCSPHIGHO2_01_FULL_38_26b]OGM59248.1 MAG: hypothetical protein A2955_05340 [Candidatus Woesebacteria bacterium RIFCSPLOWO2_01_FULL_37_19]